MDELIDSIARVLATPTPMRRRRALRYLGGALAAAAATAVGVRPVSAQACPGPNTPTQFTCGGRSGADCCNRQTQCCALRGNRGVCCEEGECICNGACSASKQNNCPSGCFLCAPA